MLAILVCFWDWHFVCLVLLCQASKDFMHNHLRFSQLCTNEPALPEVKPDCQQAAGSFTKYVGSGPSSHCAAPWIAPGLLRHTARQCQRWHYWLLLVVAVNEQSRCNVMTSLGDVLTDEVGLQSVLKKIPNGSCGQSKSFGKWMDFKCKWAKQSFTGGELLRTKEVSHFSIYLREHRSL